MSTKATLAFSASEGDEPTWHLYEGLGESGVVCLKVEHIGLAREPCSHGAAEAGMARAASEECAEIWRKENAEAIACYNAYVDKNGLPLDAFRTDV
jgi:hypothetical protein